MVLILEPFWNAEAVWENSGFPLSRDDSAAGKTIIMETKNGTRLAPSFHLFFYAVMLQQLAGSIDDRLVGRDLIHRCGNLPWIDNDFLVAWYFC